MQLYRREANTVAGHPGLNAVVGHEVSGKSLLAVEERITLMVSLRSCKSVGRLGSCPCPIAVTPSHRSGNPLCCGWAFARYASLASTAWTRSHQKLTCDAYSNTKQFPCMTASLASPGS